MTLENHSNPGEKMLCVTFKFRDRRSAWYLCEKNYNRTDKNKNPKNELSRGQSLHIPLCKHCQRDQLQVKPLLPNIKSPLQHCPECLSLLGLISTDSWPILCSSLVHGI